MPTGKGVRNNCEDPDWSCSACSTINVELNVRLVDVFNQCLSSVFLVVRAMFVWGRVTQYRKTNGDTGDFVLSASDVAITNGPITDSNASTSASRVIKKRR